MPLLNNIYGDLGYQLIFAGLAILIIALTWVIIHLLVGFYKEKDKLL